MAEMDYVELSKIEKLWAPSEYAWECLKCPMKVRVLDGHIDPKKGSLIIERCKERNRVELFTAIGIIAFGQKRTPKVNPKNLGLEVPEVSPRNLGLKEPEVNPKNLGLENAGATASAGPS